MGGYLIPVLRWPFTHILTPKNQYSEISYKRNHCSLTPSTMSGLDKNFNSAVISFEYYQAYYTLNKGDNWAWSHSRICYSLRLPNWDLLALKFSDFRQKSGENCRRKAANRDLLTLEVGLQVCLGMANNFWNGSGIKCQAWRSLLGIFSKRDLHRPCVFHAYLRVNGIAEHGLQDLP